MTLSISAASTQAYKAGISMSQKPNNIELDKDGYLKNLNDWTPEVAIQLGREMSLELSDNHWEIIKAMQKFYRQYEISPAMRPLIKYIGLELGQEKANSIYLMTLFPPSPAKIASKIAGLPRPDNCL